MKLFGGPLPVILLHLSTISHGAAPRTFPTTLSQLSNASNPHSLTRLIHLKLAESQAKFLQQSHQTDDGSALPASPAYYRIPRSTQALVCNILGRIFAFDRQRYFGTSTLSRQGESDP